MTLVEANRRSICAIREQRDTRATRSPCPFDGRVKQRRADTPVSIFRANNHIFDNGHPSSARCAHRIKDVDHAEHNGFISQHKDDANLRMFDDLTQSRRLLPDIRAEIGLLAEKDGQQIAQRRYVIQGRVPYGTHCSLPGVSDKLRLATSRSRFFKITYRCVLAESSKQA